MNAIIGTPIAVWAGEWDGSASLGELVDPNVSTQGRMLANRSGRSQTCYSRAERSR